MKINVRNIVKLIFHHHYVLLMNSSEARLSFSEYFEFKLQNFFKFPLFIKISSILSMRIVTFSHSILYLKGDHLLGQVAEPLEHGGVAPLAQLLQLDVGLELAVGRVASKS